MPCHLESCRARARMMTQVPLGYSSSYERYLFESVVACSAKFNMFIASCVYTCQEVYVVLLPNCYCNKNKDKVIHIYIFVKQCISINYLGLHPRTTCQTQLLCTNIERNEMIKGLLDLK